jgi:hypothetical protein
MLEVVAGEDQHLARAGGPEVPTVASRSTAPNNTMSRARRVAGKRISARPIAIRCCLEGEKAAEGGERREDRRT